MKENQSNLLIFCVPEALVKRFSGWGYRVEYVSDILRLKVISTKYSLMSADELTIDSREYIRNVVEEYKGSGAVVVDKEAVTDHVGYDTPYHLHVIVFKLTKDTK
ncbi:MAG: hypothetical protein H7A51_13710 [Akkermansiaceae bacterium]|nr:hypothetical protein [Akkermansiaceae bacterium]